MSQAAIDELARKGAERGVDVRGGLALVEERLRAAAASDQPILEQAGRHLIEAGGKRFRPMLVLLSGMLAGTPPTDDALVDAGAIVELVHIATLYHDDVIDGARLRRGAPAAHVKWSNTVAILTGDHLLARASELSAGLGVEVTRVMAATIAELCAGQVREVRGSRAAREHGMTPVRADREHYRTVISEKTASLVSSSCRLGALLGGLPQEAVAAAASYGHHLGMSFQLADDVLDVAGDEGESGKEPGADLREGVRTMPVLFALEAEGPGSELARLLADPDAADIAKALAILRAHPALELARDQARVEAAKARRALRPFEEGRHPAAVVEALAYLADYAADRAS